MKTHTLTAFYSKRDIYGNCEFAFIYSSPEGKEARGIISGGESNIKSIVTAMNLDWENVYFTTNEMKIREFNKFVKGWEYAGCTPKELADFIKRKV